jgi:hypothetical protein
MGHGFDQTSLRSDHPIAAAAAATKHGVLSRESELLERMHTSA